jgi:hypothetical protein
MSFTTPDMFPSMNSGLTLILIPRRSAHCHPQSGPFEMSNVKASLQNDRLVIREGRKKVVDTIVESGSSLCTSFDNDGESDWVGTEKDGKYTNHYGSAPRWIKRLEMSKSLLSGPVDSSRSYTTGPPPSSRDDNSREASRPPSNLGYSSTCGPPSVRAPAGEPTIHHASRVEPEQVRLAREPREDRPAIEADLVLVPAGSPQEEKLRKKYGTGTFSEIGMGTGKGVLYDGSRWWTEPKGKKGKSTWSCFG